MRKPQVDYRKLRLSNLRSPEYSHLLLLLGWLVYFLFYFLTENLIPPEKWHLVHCRVDDLIPFCDLFVLAYTGWYVLIVISLGYYVLYHIENFRGLQTYIITTQVIAMICYIVYPTYQDLRPAEFPRENVLTWLMGLIYSFDTPSGVCPSLHVAYSIGIASSWLKEKSACRAWKVFVVVFVVLICLSTMFVKQHSFIDVVAALPVCVVAEWVAYGRKKKR